MVVEMAKRKKSPWAAKLKRLREELGLSQSQAAEKVGVARRTWISWENDPRGPGQFAQRVLRQTFPGKL